MSYAFIPACAATVRASSSSELRGKNDPGPSSCLSSSRGPVRPSSSVTSSPNNSTAMLSSRTSLARGAGRLIAARGASFSSRRGRSLTIVANLGGQYGDTFGDVDRVLVSYFTFRALKETLAQIQETDLSPGKADYKWLYTFATEHNPNDSQAFIKALFAERQDYGQRILAQRQALFDSWQSEFRADTAAKIIEDQNLEHLRDHLFSTVNLDEGCLALDDPRECLTPEEKNAMAVELEEEDETIA